MHRVCVTWRSSDAKMRLIKSKSIRISVEKRLTDDLYRFPGLRDWWKVRGREGWWLVIAMINDDTVIDRISRNFRRYGLKHK